MRIEYSKTVHSWYFVALLPPNCAFANHMVQNVWFKDGRWSRFDKNYLCDASQVNKPAFLALFLVLLTCWRPSSSRIRAAHGTCEAASCRRVGFLQHSSGAIRQAGPNKIMRAQLWSSTFFNNPTTCIKTLYSVQKRTLVGHFSLTCTNMF